MTSLLIVSFSPIHRDPRVLRQINTLSDDYEITTLGFGRRPEAAVRHVKLNAAETLSAPRKALAGASMLCLPPNRRYQVWSEGAAALQWVKLNGSEFDVVFTNDVLAVPIGVASGKPFHADLHEYALDQGKSLRWKMAGMPMVRWAASQLVKAQSTSTVAPGIAAKYEEAYGIDPFVVNNAPNYQPNITPKTTNNPIRLIHMGAAGRPRKLEMPIRAVIEANKQNPGSITLDYYLVPGEQAYIEELRHLAGNPNTTGVTLKTPVTFEEILPTLHQYDTALAFFPPTTVNLKHTLPNKFFEAVQARIGVITGPSPEMGPYIHKYGFGTTTTGWTQDDLNQTITNLNPQTINTWKQAANKAAPHLGAEQQDQKWLTAINKLLEEVQQ